MTARPPVVDLARRTASLQPDLGEAIDRVLRSGWFLLGPETEAFEAEFAAFCGRRHAVAVASGTEALRLALRAFGVGAGDEVIVPAFTFVATATAVLHAGATPVLADVEPDTGNLGPEGVAKALTSRTRAVVPVHLYGQMSDMAAINDIAGRRGLLVIEDAAQAHGASAAGRRAGAHGHAAAFSFYPTKNLGAYGDGGAVTSDDAGLVGRVRVLRQGGHPAAMQATDAGVNSRLDELQAAVLRVKLRHLDRWNGLRRGLAAEYDSGLRGGRGGVEPPAEREAGAHVFHLYVARHPDRARLIAHLKARGVEAMIHYPYLLHQQPLFRRRGQRALPVAERLAGSVLSLSLHPHLSPDELHAVTDAVRAFKP